MNRDQIFKKYPHDTQKKGEVPMHSHSNGQLEYVSKGTMRLITPNAAWVVPQQRIIWIPPGQSHSVRCNRLSGSWKIMAPRSYSKFLPKTVSVLRTSKLLVAALESVPENQKSISSQKLKLLIEVIKCELQAVDSESFAVTLPRSAQLNPLVDTLLDHPEDPRSLDVWAKQVGMSRRTFTRHFMDETGSTFGRWRTALLLGKALDLLSEGHSVSEISYRLGYSSPSAFVAAFRIRFGVPPGKFFNSNGE
jgi:AraC-like DNA-binding protein